MNLTKIIGILLYINFALLVYPIYFFLPNSILGLTLIFLSGICATFSIMVSMRKRS